MSARWHLLGLLALAATAVIYVYGIVGPGARPQGDPDFVSSDAALERLVDGDQEDLILAEGVVVTCDGRVLFSDITTTASKPGRHGGLRAGHLLEYHAATGAISVFRSPSGMANGNRMDLECHLLTAEMADFGGRRLIRTDLATGRAEIVTARYDGKPYNSPNDIALDRRGRIYFTDPRYLGDEPIEQPVMGIYRVDPDGSVHRIIGDAGMPNGIAVCPDERHLYVGSYDNRQGTGEERMALLQYDLDADGNASNRKVLVDYTPEEGPDGMVCDVEGNLWVAVQNRKRPGIYAYALVGGIPQERAYIPTPKPPTNLHFGRGDAAHDLYITAGNSLYRIRVGKQGHHLQ